METNNKILVQGDTVRIIKDGDAMHGQYAEIGCIFFTFSKGFGYVLIKEDRNIGVYWQDEVLKVKDSVIYARLDALEQTVSVNNELTLSLSDHILKKSASKNEEPKMVNIERDDTERLYLGQNFKVGDVCLVRGENLSLYVGKIRRISQKGKYAEIERGSAVWWVAAWQVVDHVG